jgi:hypothetical protein
MVRTARQIAGDLDGREFHVRQRISLDEALRRGLRSLAFPRARIAA